MRLRLPLSIIAAVLAPAVFCGPAAQANPVMRPLTTECVVNAAALYRLPEPLVWTILYVEGGRVGTVSENKNGTADLGPMQINTSWLKTFAPQYGITPTELRSRLVWDGCFNVAIGSWILRHNIDGCGGFWCGVTRYHSSTPHLAARYLRLVINGALTLFGPAAFAETAPAS